MPKPTGEYAARIEAEIWSKEGKTVFQRIDFVSQGKTLGVEGVSFLEKAFMEKGIDGVEEIVSRLFDELKESFVGYVHGAVCRGIIKLGGDDA